MQTNNSILPNDDRPTGFLSKIVGTFLEGQMAIVLIVASLVLGLAAIFLTAREEEPQIVVPMADVFVSCPGSSANEIEKLVTTPLEKYLWQIDGVEHVYSVSNRGGAVVTVRFFVGENREDSLVKLYNKINSHIQYVNNNVANWLIKPVEIDDVPIVTVSLHSTDATMYQLRRVADEVVARLEPIENISRTRIVGGSLRQLRVDINPDALKAYGLDIKEVQQIIKASNTVIDAGEFIHNNKNNLISSGKFFNDLNEVKNVVVGVKNITPIYLKDIAKVYDGAQELHTYTRIGSFDWKETQNAVTIAIAKKRGTNAVTVSKDVLEKLHNLSQNVIPTNIQYTITRNNGEQADQNVNNLLSSLVFAMVSVVVLLIFTLGWREGLIVALAVPISFALALFVNYISGYTINRVTLFALILTLGLVVDDPITNVDNIQRHILKGKHKPFNATLWAVKEVLPPVIMSTVAIIVSFLPMFFITGMMGPYMEPMAVNVPLTVTMSTIAALSVVPWAAYNLLKKKSGLANLENDNSNGKNKTSFLKKIYTSFMQPLLNSAKNRWALLGAIVLLLGFSALLVVMRLVPMKMLPFANKDTLQLVIDMPEGSSLELTDAVVRDFEQYLLKQPQIESFQSYVGVNSPMDFNGLVRHYYLRNQPHIADIHINLISKKIRQEQSHNLALSWRHDLEKIAQKHNAKLAIVEQPPGPPVFATITAEIYGNLQSAYADILKGADIVKAKMVKEPGVCDVNSTIEAKHFRYEFIVDKTKAALHGISISDINASLAMFVGGLKAGDLHLENQRNAVPIFISLARKDKAHLQQLKHISIKSKTGLLIDLNELGYFKKVIASQPIYHKDLKRVAFVMADTAGRAPGECVLDLASFFNKNPLPNNVHINWSGEGEWKITIRVFRDLGLAFGAAMIGIYILLIIQTSSFIMPLVIMSAIPLTAIGIMPGFWLLNIITNHPIGGYDTPVFFTATAMIGMIALGGIVVRNSIVLIEFIEDNLKTGATLQESILDSGVVRMRPILLTAATTALGAVPITLDPIFSGLAWSLIFGLFASTVFTLFVVPTLYYMIYKKAKIN